VIEIRAGIDASNKLTFWEFDNWNSGNSGLPTPYVVANQRVVFHASDSPLRQGSYRGLAATANHYAREMHMDAIARALSVDPVEFRLKHLEDARMRAVLTKAAEQCRWPRPSQPGRAPGHRVQPRRAVTSRQPRVSLVPSANTPPSSTRRPAPSANTLPFARSIAWSRSSRMRRDRPSPTAASTAGGLGRCKAWAARCSRRFASRTWLQNGTLQRSIATTCFRETLRPSVVLLDQRDLPSAGAGETPIVCVAPAIGSALRAFGTVAPALPVTLTTFTKS
jgi:isoquinoline 1-oxidoreductase